ncbi:hypothetical protein BU14_0032s0015 [Porphyra umbilicalis]|uniref:Uncharacterized protein n=1 Tax=Porphyra umbilicalis TaxID=2786 RepID=A0A1X6PIU1_PORUM|nr:hypothetical protein BU14_0032s0015 [Porphyra umbilicalis]|eukprot:OSX80757.1 hypothetical protein BU14_0032s0015 [Porphyra umbilicalis]
MPPYPTPQQTARPPSVCHTAIEREARYPLRAANGPRSSVLLSARPARQGQARNKRQCCSLTKKKYCQKNERRPPDEETPPPHTLGAGAGRAPATSPLLPLTDHLHPAAPPPPPSVSVAPPIPLQRRRCRSGLGRCRLSLCRHICRQRRVALDLALKRLHRPRVDPPLRRHKRRHLRRVRLQLMPIHDPPDGLPTRRRRLGADIRGKLRLLQRRQHVRQVEVDERRDRLDRLLRRRRHDRVDEGGEEGVPGGPVGRRLEEHRHNGGFGGGGGGGVRRGLGRGRRRRRAAGRAAAIDNAAGATGSRRG